MKHIVWILVAAMLLGACGRSYEDQKRVTRAERLKRMKEDSAALKIAVMPTLDCLPLYVASQYGLFDTLGVDIRLKRYTAQIDCDTAIANGRVEGAVTDLVRGQRLAALGTAVAYVTATNAYWQLISNRTARINTLRQLSDKMVAMTRYSATDLLADHACDSAKLKREHVFKIQINDVSVRLGMLQNNEMDAMFLTEPQATAARVGKHKVLMDTRRLGVNLGAIAFRSNVLSDSSRKRQIDAFIKAYDMACDSINKHGAGRYATLVAEDCKVKPAIADSIGKGVRFDHAAPPRQTDIDKADEWLKKAK